MRKCFKNFRGSLQKRLFLVLLLVPVTVLAAGGQIAVKGKALGLKQAIELIEKSSDYTFFYKTEDLKNVSPRDINCEGTIEEVLEEVFKGSNINYNISGNDIALRVQSTKTVQQQAQKKRTVTGTVVDANTKETLIGANVKVKGSDTGTITDVDGNFSLEVTSSKDVIVVSYIGYKTVERVVEEMGVIHFELPSDSELLNEVVVVGFGTQKKVSVVGSITNIKASSLKTPSSSLNSTFGGRLAGVISTTSSGEPGKNSSDFYIRGIGTFGGRATPLIMLDGVEISTNDLNYIPAESIESFSILKDASATAIYGARGANGVMLVTTKVGSENEKTRINVSVENSFNLPMSFPEFADGVTYMQMYNEATYTRTGNYTGLPYTQEQINNTRAGLNPYVYPNVDWKALMFKDMSLSQRANVNIQGGGSKANYYLSLQVNHDTGVLNTKKIYSFDNNVNVWGYTFQSNVDYKITPTTKVGLRMNAQMRTSTGPHTSTSDLFKEMLNANPVTFPAYYPNSKDAAGEDHMLFGNRFRVGDATYMNPYANMLTTYGENLESTILATVDFEQKLDFITKGLKLKGLVSFKNWSSSYFNRTIQPYYYTATPSSYDPYDPVAADYTLERVGTSGTDYIVQSAPTKNGDRTFQFQASLEWARNFGGVHDLSAMLLYLQREYRINALPTRNQGLSGRVTYAYDQRYLFEANFGYNGTERLASGHRFELFPSFAAGWVISNEKFFEPLTDIVSNLKVRGSWGLVGNDETGLTDIRTGVAGPHFIYLDDISINDGNMGFTTGVDMNTTYYGPLIKQYGTKDATWERSSKANIGLDVELFRKITLAFDIFQDKRSNILLRRERFPEYMGYNAGKPWGSVGKVENKGLELAVNYTEDLTKDVSVDLRGTFTFNRAKMVYSDEPTYALEYRRKDGKSLNGTWGYVAERLFVDQADIDNSPTQRFGNSPMPGDLKYKDLNGDGMIDESDMCEISPYGGTPGIMYGFGTTIRYKNFDFGVFFQGAAQRTVMISGIHPFGNSKKNVLQFIADDYWTEDNPNPNAAYPRLDYREEANNNRSSSTYWMRNGAYLRFKNAEIGYNFKFGRVFLTGENLLTFSPFKLWDPELAWYSYPLSRTFNIGVKLNF